MQRAETRLPNALASRVFSPIVRDWEKPLALLRIIVENFVLVGIALFVSRWLSPADPFSLDQQFPWLWMVPTVLALRYGTMDGVFAVTLILAAWLLPEPWGMTGGKSEPLFPQEYFLGGLVLVLVAGQFADVWNGRLSRIRAANAHLDERLVSLTRTHYLTRLSHQRLEQELLIRPVMLSDVLNQLRPSSPDEADTLANADTVLRMLASSCDIEAASIHVMTNSRLDSAPVASIGEAASLNHDDPMIVRALEDNQLVHVHATEASTYQSEYLVCAPIRTCTGRSLGMLVVRTMPFFTLNEENLQFIAVLLGYYADGLARSQAIHSIIALRPDTPPDFALELVRMKRLFDSSRIASSIVALSFDNGPKTRPLYEHVRRSKRATDLAWEIETANKCILVLMMPMAGHAAVEGMINRIEHVLSNQFKTSLTEAQVGVYTTGMSNAEAEWVLDDFLNRCGISPQQASNSRVELTL